MFIKIHKNNTQGIENNNKSSPSRYVSEHPKTQWGITTHDSKQQLFILDHLQVTHTKSNILKHKGWDFTNTKVKHIIHQLQLTIIKHHQLFTFIIINNSSRFKYGKHLNFIKFFILNNKGIHNYLIKIHHQRLNFLDYSNNSTRLCNLSS